MRDSRLPYLIAIDGGGTSCRFALQAPDRRLVVRGGSANVYSAPDQALAVLREGLAELAGKSGLEPAAFRRIPVYAGLAGVIDRAAAQFVESGLPHDHVLAEEDWRPAVAGALGARDGCLIGIGTGSFLARQKGAEIVQIGGYGARLGDEASGGWLGLRLVQAALHVLDGLAPSSPLVEDCLAGFGHDAAQIVRFAMQARPADFGAYAPRIVAAAKDGDAAGRVLMGAGADYIRRGLEALGRQPGEPVCPAGGVAAHYADFLPEEVAQSFVAPAGEALDGAVELARRFADTIEEERA